MRILLAILILVGFESFGQDIHFTQYYYAPSNYNPAHIGDFDGDYRIIGNERRQWASVTIPYQTFALSGDAHNFLKVKGLGVMANIQNDKAGDSQFTTTIGNLGVSYNLGTIDTIHSFIVGAQIGVSNKRFSTDKLRYDNQYNGFVYDPNIASIENFGQLSNTYFNFNIGLKYNLKFSAKTRFFAGVSGYNLTKPTETFFANSQIKLDRRFNVELGADHKINSKLGILPGLLLSFQGKYAEYNFGAQISYLLKNEPFDTWVLYGGLWGRAKDAGNVNLGLGYNNWTFGASYDVNLSSLQPASQNRGGLELAIIYIFKSFGERPKFKVCPDYI